MLKSCNVSPATTYKRDDGYDNGNAMTIVVPRIIYYSVLLYKVCYDLDEEYEFRSNG